VKDQDATRLDPDNWVDAYGDALLGFALARVKNSDAAEDLVQETYFAALRSQKNFKGMSSEKTWLFGILKHKVLDHFGKARKMLFINDVLPNPDGSEMFSRAPSSGWNDSRFPGADPEKDYIYREFLDHFYRGLSMLPKRAAAVFIYREIEGFSTEEIRQIFSISKSNCWTIFHRAKGRLRKHLEIYGFKPST
jgi:RNA polymerase sigma-70 factor (ECF subfamily)